MFILNKSSIKILQRVCNALLCAAVLIAFTALTPKADAQISIQIGPPPVCPYGYYDYAPYRCAPVGFYGPGYFYNGIFLGVGPWANWGYAHGWGRHRFVGPRGGRYYPRHRYYQGHRYAGRREYRGYGRGHEHAMHDRGHEHGGHEGRGHDGHR